MKAMHILLASATIMAALALPGTSRADTATVTVNATVLPTCKFGSKTATMNFADIDPSSTAAVQAPELTLQYRCTTASSHSVLVDGSATGSTSRQLKHSAASSSSAMNYTVTWTAPTNAPGRGFGVGRPEFDLKLNATIAADQFQGAQAGQHTDAIVVTVNSN
jgi:hypothetical protein